MNPPPSLTIDLIVLAGGRGSRLGGVLKPAVEVAGRTLLSRVLDARPVARSTVVVGPPAAQPAAGTPPFAAQPAAGSATPSALIWALEDPPFGGPVAGIAAGLAALATHSAAQGATHGDMNIEANGEANVDEPATWLLVLACDLPWGADAARLLVTAASALEKIGEQTDGVHLTDYTGHAQWLAGIYRAPALRAAVDRLGDRVNGASMRDLLSGLKLLGLMDESETGVDVDTWQDVDSSTARLTGVPEVRPEE
ncbi:molybdenum cofactor guanylyltransferase [Cryobacterium sp. Y62]|uniref:molybdenum cofactor guanylyltransferase n=1 Tax=Cryobacterium sp. Y62 TaxID=2048284 RepID=UPI000CE39A2E|nr:NTP transferase domain-containing protein [Cryobacterium sp. Y62]